MRDPEAHQEAELDPATQPRPFPPGYRGNPLAFSLVLLKMVELFLRRRYRLPLISTHRKKQKTTGHAGPSCDGQALVGWGGGCLLAPGVRVSRVTCSRTRAPRGFQRLLGPCVWTLSCLGPRAAQPGCSHEAGAGRRASCGVLWRQRGMCVTLPCP